MISKFLKKEESPNDIAPKPQETTESPSHDHLAQSSENQEVQIVVTDETVAEPEPTIETGTDPEQLNMVTVFLSFTRSRQKPVAS